MKLYRLGHFAYSKNIPLFPDVCNLLIRLIHNSAIYSETLIGANTIFGYGGISVVIHKRVVIGSNCTIGTNVTIGGKSGSKNVPVIGNDVFIATGAKILGDLKIGNNCVIGANAVVVKDVPDNCVVAGIPAKIIKTDINMSDFK